MTKYIIEFNLPDDLDDLNCAIRGGDYAGALEDIERIIRGVEKYNQNKDNALNDIKEIINNVQNLF